MTSRIFASFVALFALCLSATAQVSVTPEQARRADELYMKLHRVEMLNLVLPLVMTKEQILKLLPPIEKARAAVKQIQDDEFRAMERLEKKADEALKQGAERGMMPPKELLDEIATFVKNSRNRQAAQTLVNVDSVLSEMEKVLNPGQLKAAANTLDLAFYEPGIKEPDKASQTVKLGAYVKWVLLDPATYDILREMAK